MNQAQRQYLASLVRSEFASQGYRGGIQQAVQVDAAVMLVHAAIKANAPGMIACQVQRAVTHVRTGRLANVPARVRTVQPCTCGTPKAAHTADMHR